MTLIEMLIATAVSLILMAAVAQVFAAFSGAMSNGRSILETDSRLRNVARRLRDDLNGATTQMLPPRTPDQGEGYFEVIEGPLNDYQDASNSGAALVSGTINVCPTDIDDVLLFTTRDTESPFVGRINSAGSVVSLESSTAEVAWFVRPTPTTSNPVTYTLFRKQLLVMGYVGVVPSPFSTNNQITYSPVPTTPPPPDRWRNYYLQPCDISARRECVLGSFDRIVPNTLSDLTRRENRFLHNSSGDTVGADFPYPFVSHSATAVPDGLIFDGNRLGEDIILSNVLAFDVRVFDPAAPISLSGSTAVLPGDPGFSVVGSGSGAYVDLGHGVLNNGLLNEDVNGNGSFDVGEVDNNRNFRADIISPYFGGFGNPLSQLAGSATSRRTYCTWSTHYEANGIDEDGDGTTDEGTDGLDNPPVNSLVDENNEQETRPPYPYPLRGVEVRIRVYEPKSRQVRQVTVRHTFVPH